MILENENFITRTRCQFIIKTNDKSPDIISNRLGLAPDRYFSKGDKVESKNSKNVGIKQSGLWAISSDKHIGKKENISDHLNYLKETLDPKKNILNRIRQEFNLVYLVRIWIETDDAGIGFDMTDLDISFLHSLHCRVSFSLICVDSVKE